MDLETLGERIKIARKAQGLSQAKLIHKIQFSMEQRTLSSWENGERRPHPENLHDLARTLGLRYEEETYWLGLAGYIQPTFIPRQDQIETALDIYYADIQNYPYPAQILDYRNNYWAINPATSAFFGGYDIAAEFMKEKMQNMFELIFRSELGLGDGVPDMDAFRRQQIVLFILTNLHRRHEAFWKSYPECWKSILSLSDYHRFEAMWYDVCHEYLDGLGSSKHIIQAVVNFSYVDFQTPDGKHIRFKVLVEAPVYFYHHVFDILRYIPVDEVDRVEAERFFRRFQTEDPTKLALWKVHNIKDILESFNEPI